MNLQLHYTYSDQPSKMAVLEGTSTNYPNKSQLGRISYEFIKQNEKKNSDERIDRNILHNLHGTTETL